VRFAQKACSNIHIMRLMRAQGVKEDSVSLGEIERALAAGYEPQTFPEDIVFTADVIDAATQARVSELHIPVNAGSV
ncbi:diaminopimelate decarboxylase, partial [Salmonella enterica subsp. enterica serovar Weltevreden]|nr:diaminopimelate decarboxylase [Salmonella enterica subsp. enterica serovar Weltevreden]